MKKQIPSVITMSVVLLLIASTFGSCIQEETFSKTTIETFGVSSVTEESAIGGGIINSNGSDTISVSGVCWSTSENPTTANNKTTDGSLSGPFESTLIGLISGTKYYVRAYATNNIETIYGNQEEFRTLVTPITVTDVDGNIYNTVTIGTQTWMVENLRTTKYNDSTSIPLVSESAVWKSLLTPGYCWNDKDAPNNKIYGAYYNWYTINKGKLAPKGWHVPTDSEWIVLENYLITNGYNCDGTTTDNKIAKSLAATTGWPTSTYFGTIGKDLYKNNTSGFTGLPSGCRTETGEFFNVGYSCAWWSSTESVTYYYSSAWSRYMYYEYDCLEKFNINKQEGLPIRCLRDN